MGTGPARLVPQQSGRGHSQRRRFALGQWKLNIPSLPPATRPETSAHWYVNSIGMTMVLIPSGEFLMGSPNSDKDAQVFEKPQHRVRITKPFWLGMNLVTVGQFRNFAKESNYYVGTVANGFPSVRRYSGVSVGWDNAKAFCDWLSRGKARSTACPRRQSGNMPVEPARKPSIVLETTKATWETTPGS